MLVRVDYPNSSADVTDATHAHYDYRTDNVHEDLTTQKRYPLLQRCDDVRYNGPMRTIRYEYQNHYPHGFIWNEEIGGGAVSTISPTGPDTFTETRGDGSNGPRPDKDVHLYAYASLHRQSRVHNLLGLRDSNPPQQMLDHYTDFQGHSTQLGYDGNWYISSVTDANTHQTRYDRGNPPPSGIGEIKHYHSSWRQLS